MKKRFLLAAVALSLLLLGYGILWPGSSDAMPMPQASAFILDKGVAEEIVTDLDGDGKVDPGDTIRYSIAYENTGEVEATNVKIVDDYDQSLIVSITNISGKGKDDSDTITWDLGTVPAGASSSVTYDAILNSTFPTGATDVTNKATISSAETAPATSTKTVTVEGPNLTVEKGVAAALIKDLDGDGVIDPGDTIRYTITYENIGGIEATNVTIVDDYDQTLLISIADISDGGVNDEDAVTWSIGKVAAGASGSITYDATLNSMFPTGPTDVINTATIRSVETAPASNTKTVTVEAPGLTIDKGVAGALVNDLDGDGVVDPGDTIEYIITYENIGGGEATNVTIVDDYDQTLIESIPNISGNGKDDGDTIKWDIGTVKGGVGDSVTFEATLKKVFAVGSTSVENKATISSKEIEEVSIERLIVVEVTPMPTPTPVRPVEGPAAGIFAGREKSPLILIGILAAMAMGVLAFVGAIAEYSPKKTHNGELTRERVALVREGVFLIFIVSSIMLLAIGGGVESDGAISILSAIVGYVFGRVTTGPN